jgi:hypothetical protein
MNYREKKTFVNQLISSVRRDIIAKLSNTPPEWDGHELRKYIADKFADQTSNVMGGATPDRRRKAAYNNEVLVRNL